MRKKVLIYGRVQGVFYRKFIRDNALKLNIKGYVRNLEDGSVEAVFESGEEQVKKMIEICRKGSFGSRVDKILVSDLGGKEKFDGFEVRY